MAYLLLTVQVRVIYRLRYDYYMSHIIPRLLRHRLSAVPRQHG